VAIGIDAYAGYGFKYINNGYVSVDNSGTVNATSDYYLAAGVIASGYYDVTVTNSGDINASGYLAAYGVIAQSVYGHVSLSHPGSVAARAISAPLRPGLAFPTPVWRAEATTGAGP